MRTPVPSVVPLGGTNGHGSAGTSPAALTPLLPPHEAMLRASGIKPDVAAAREYASVTDPAHLKTLGFAPAQCRVPALLVPIWNVHGKVVALQSRPDTPREVDGKVVKYESRHGDTNVLDVPPGVRGRLGDPEDPLVITEGCKKADGAVSRGMTCVALTGVWSWRGTNAHGGKTALADWDAIALNGRPVYIAFDSDVTEKREVRAALNRLAAFLTSRGARVFDVRLPGGPAGEKVGLDDWLVAGHMPMELFAIARPVEDTADQTATTDFGNAERLVAAHGDDLRYTPSLGWLAWTGRHWARDTTGEVMRRAKATARAIYAEAAEVIDKDTRKQIADWGKMSENAARLGAMISLAESEPGIPVRPGDLDRDPWALNVLNGTLDLRTGERRPFDRTDLITKLAPIAYDPTATCPRFDRFLADIFAPHPDVIPWLQKFVGHCLSGDASEDIFSIWWGTGANGKTTLKDVLHALLGDYALSTPATTFLAKRSPDHIPNDIARLAGARLVTAVEPERGAALAEALVKATTGRDPLPARFLHREWFEFVPEFKPVLVTNSRPTIRGVEEAIWRRLRLVPFAVTITPTTRDPHLSARLRAELPGILNWALAGCLAWQREGLAPPATIRAATETYRADSDWFRDFLDECCVVAPEAQAPPSTLYEEYARWARVGRRPVMSQRKFGLLLGERGFLQVKSGDRFWRGLCLREPPSADLRARLRAEGGSTGGSSAPSARNEAS